ncbi:MAG: hypothetical protein PVJ67_03375 [Candidatus Pacearchaeota archaeon]|jgi:hypothetical protein
MDIDDEENFNYREAILEMLRIKGRYYPDLARKVKECFEENFSRNPEYNEFKSNLDELVDEKRIIKKEIDFGIYFELNATHKDEIKRRLEQAWNKPELLD